MHRTRIGVRGLMIVVAVVGVGAGLLARHRRFGAIAAEHRAERSGLMVWLMILGHRPPVDRRADWLAAMIEKYDQAARRPWLPIAPDPPEPPPVEPFEPPVVRPASRP